MRIIAGKHRSRKLLTISELDTRPTSDRLKESLFNALGGRCDKQLWLDLFAGSGAIGLEALSRGASFVVFNDSNPKACAMIEKNIEALKEQSSCIVMNLDALACIQQLNNQSYLFDVIYIDPPYKQLLDPIILEITKASFISKDTIFIIEREKADALTQYESLVVLKHKVVGKSQYNILKMR